MTANRKNSTKSSVENYHIILKERLAYRMSLVLAVIFSILSTVFFFESWKSFSLMSFILLVCLYCLLILRLKKDVRQVFYIYGTGGVSAIAISLFFIPETSHLVDAIWLLATSFLVTFGIGKKAGIFYFMASLSVLVLTIFFSLNKHLTVQQPAVLSQQIAIVVEVIASFVIIFYLYYLFTSMNRFSIQKMRSVNLQLTQQNEKIRLQNEEKSLLIREIYHRVKNNLQIIIGLLRLQSSETKDEQVKQQLDDSIQRIMAMSLIHEKLYKDDSISQIKFNEYVNELFETILKTDIRATNVQYKITSNIEKLGLKSLIPIGLMLNELVSNSLKHAFDEKDGGMIELMVCQLGDINEIELIYKDNGTWKVSAGEENQGFGLQLINALVDQLDGKMQIEKCDNESVFTIVVKNLMDKQLAE
ncbi:MAG: hypothetical protein M9916_12780 [Crocinitomicaceae bacterium]|nr:hypothetical protein [Crocinitomicaceae bacterium]